MITPCKPSCTLVRLNQSQWSVVNSDDLKQAMVSISTPWCTLTSALVSTKRNVYFETQLNFFLVLEALMNPG